MSYKYIIGCDEVGSGPVAGPSVVVGVKAFPDWNLEGLNDSKKLSEKKRNIMTEKLKSLINKGDICFYLAERSNTFIDEHGFGVALKDAYVEIFKNLNSNDSHIIVDGTLKFNNLGVDDCDIESIVKADTKIPTVMAASILAKTHRDNLMKEYSKLHPNYNWENNMGYPTADHISAIKKYGYTNLHRLSFKLKALAT